MLMFICKEVIFLKKMIFHTTNTIICALFLNIRLAFLLFGDISALDQKTAIIVNVLTAIISTIMIISIIIAISPIPGKI